MSIDSQTHWQSLRRSWRIQCGTITVLPIILVWIAREPQAALNSVGVPLFVLGLLTLLLTLWRYRLYRAAVLQIDAVSGSEQAPSAWDRVRHTQLLGLSMAKLPGWVGMLHYVCTAELTPLILLVLASIGVMLLYRPPSARFN